MKQWSPSSNIDDIRAAVLSLDILIKSRDRRNEVLRKLSNPVPDVLTGRTHNENVIPPALLRLPEADGAPISHTAFRQKMKDATGYKEVRLVLRAQLLRCEWPRDILRIMAVAMLHRKTAEQLCLLHEPIMRALYRCRNNVTDKDVLSAITVIFTRFNVAGLRPHDMLIHMGFKFAARARSLRGMKRFLRLQRERDNGMSRNQFRSVIAKFSIGHRGLGEIRNGRWRRSELLQVLTGFDDDADLPTEEQYHLGSFLHRQDWQYLHGWVAVLARCKASDAIWEEWRQWKICDARQRPKTLQSHARMNTRIRGDYWFIEQMAYSGDIKRAWQLLEESDVPFERLKSRVTHRLLDHLEFCTVWGDAIAAAMLRKYDHELGVIEKAFGVTWEAAGEDGDGRHVLFRDQEEALEGLSAEDWTPNENFGFPHADNAPLATEQEQLLHDAPEGNLRLMSIQSDAAHDPIVIQPDLPLRTHSHRHVGRSFLKYLETHGAKISWQQNQITLDRSTLLSIIKQHTAIAMDPSSPWAIAATTTPQGGAPAFSLKVDDMTLNAIHALLIQNRTIFKERTHEQRNITGSYYIAFAQYLMEHWPKLFDYETNFGEESVNSVAARNTHSAALKTWISEQVDSLRYLPCKGSELEHADGKCRDMNGRIVLHEAAIHFIGTDPKIRICISEITEPKLAGLMPKDVAAGLTRLRIALAQHMGKGQTIEKAPFLHYNRGGRLIELKRDDDLASMIAYQHAKLNHDTHPDFQCQLGWLGIHKRQPNPENPTTPESECVKRTWRKGTSLHDPLDLGDIPDPSRWEKFTIPRDLLSIEERLGTEDANAPRPEYTDRTDLALITLLNRAGALSEKRVAIGIVRPWESDDHNARDVRWCGAPQLIVTAGWSFRMNHVDFQVRDVNLNLWPMPGTGPDKYVEWRELKRRGMVLLGRFVHAEENDVRDFAYAMFKADTFDPSALPLRSRSPSARRIRVPYYYEPGVVPFRKPMANFTAARHKAESDGPRY